MRIRNICDKVSASDFLEHLVLGLGYEVFNDTIAKILAIKALREATGWQLRDAKEAIEFGTKIAEERRAGKL